MKGFGLIVLSFFMVVACGPIQSTLAIHEADGSIEAARLARGPKIAPYEFTSAELYLHQAREEASYSEFSSAVRYARRAKTLADQAKEKAIGEPVAPGEGGKNK